MPKFQKKPVVVEARQINTLRYDEACEILRWAGGYAVDYSIDAPDSVIGEIPTLEGNHYVTQDDWIIKGIKGEFYPCKPDIFADSYELVEE